MTIGIGAYGPDAGLAIFRALQAAERLGEGAIGGFASFAAITTDGKLLRHQTQRGGSGTLFIAGEATGVHPPTEVACATAAAVISSGPDRPEPLAQFLTADPRAGLVTGHRLPNAQSHEGRPLNVEVLDSLAVGCTAQEAVDLVLDQNRESDAGFIAVDRRGHIYCRNSDRVTRRPDLGHARLVDNGRAAVIEVLHNAIKPAPSLASVVAAIGMGTMLGSPQPDGWITIKAGIRLEHGRENAVVCGIDSVAQKVVTTDSMLIQGQHICAAIYLHSAVYRNEEFLGKTMFEPIVTVQDGVIIEMSGQKTMQMSYGQ